MIFKQGEAAGRRGGNIELSAVFSVMRGHKERCPGALFGLLMFLGWCEGGLADNWHGSITSRLQVDNRLTNGSSFLAEAIGRFEYDNKKYDLKGGADVLLRGGNYDFNNRQEFYRLFLQKDFKGINTTVKFGRFEQTDAMGFYTLNGVSALVHNDKKNMTVEVYAGKPQRFDDLQSAKGNVVVGMKGTLHYEPKWRSELAKVSVDTVDVRLGYQYFDGPDVSRYNPARNRRVPDEDGHKVSLGMSVGGQLPAPLKKYEARMIGIYRMDTNTMEDLQVETQLDMTDKTRLRASYEYYRPDQTANPTFREQFYSQYGLGQKQELLKVSVHQQWRDYVTFFVGGIYSAQLRGEDGYGVDGGVSSRFFRNFNLALEADHIHLNQDQVSALYLKNEYFINSRNSAILSLALRQEEKQLAGENLAKGAEARWNYMIKNNIVLGLTGKYIWNSRNTLEDEFLAAVQVTYYFDNFKPKEAQ